MTIVIERVSKHFEGRRGRVDALAPVSTTIKHGEFVSLVGPSGCGKSTLLHIIGGLMAPSSGGARLDGHTVRGPGVELGVVFQRQTLFPWLSVMENVRFSQKLKRHRKSRFAQDKGTDEWITNLLHFMGLWDFRTSRPSELSGGMQQRVAIARALVAQPKVLLMDEPLGALDAQTREEMQELLLHLAEQYQTTTVLVTHDVEEALLLSDRILVFSARPGRIVNDIDVPFGRAQRGADLRLGSEFIRLKRSILTDLRVPTASGHRTSLLHEMTNRER